MLAPCLFVVAVDLGILIFLFHNQEGCEETKNAFWLGSTCYKPSANSLQNQLLFFLFKFIKASN